MNAGVGFQIGEHSTVTGALSELSRNKRQSFVSRAKTKSDAVVQYQDAQRTSRQGLA